MFEEMGAADATELDRVTQISRDYFNEALRSGTYKAWVAESADGAVIAGGGIVVAAWPGYPGEPAARRAWILNMYTEPAARRKGIARKLMEVMIDWCREERFLFVALHASDFGRSIYQALGFHPTNEMRLDLAVPSRSKP